jgi:hypothetical protein
MKSSGRMCRGYTTVSSLVDGVLARLSRTGADVSQKVRCDAVVNEVWWGLAPLSSDGRGPIRMRSLSAKRPPAAARLRLQQIESDAASLGLSPSAYAAPATVVSCFVFFFAASDSQFSVMRRRYFACEGRAAKEHSTDVAPAISPQAVPRS